MNYSHKTLEFNDIISKVIVNTNSYEAKRKLNNIKINNSLDEVHLMLYETEDMLNLIIKYGKLPFLEHFDNNILTKKDIERIYNIEEFVYLRLFLLMEKDFLLYKENIENKNIIFNNYFNEITMHKDLLDKMLFVFNEYGEINDFASRDLSEIRKNIRRLNLNLQNQMQNLLSRYSSYLTEDVIVTRNNRYCLAVKDSYKNKVKGVIHDISSSKQTVFIEPDISLSLTAEIERFKILEEKEILEILKELTQLVNNELFSLKNNLNIFIDLDIIMAKAIYAKEIEGYKPKINKDGYINLINAKHPLLNLDIAVPISLSLNKDDNTLLITGPNTGGKTVALKTVGLLTLMTQTGILIPASPDSNIAIFDNIFADIGDEQSITHSLSTFSSHMTKIVDMINNLTNNSLILLDELGSGTDPIEGVALAISIIEEIRLKDVRLIVTSHYSELKTYAYETKGIITASVAFDKNSLKPLYYLQHGISGDSHARLIAERLGLKESVLKRANELYSGRETDLAKIMTKLNQEKEILEKEKLDLSNKIKEYEIAKENYLYERNKLIKEKELEIKKVREVEESKWNKTNEELRLLIEELKKKEKLTQPELASVKGKMRQLPSETKIETKEKLKVGDQVFIKPYQQYGEVKSISNNKYQVVFGIFDLEFNNSDLTKVNVASKKEDNKYKRYKNKPKSNDDVTKQGSLTLDLRGYRAHEVKEAIDDAIDNALLSNLYSLKIIHGFGTGAVRKEVYKYIEKSSHISSHRFGGEGEGLNGVTIIELK